MKEISRESTVYATQDIYVAINSVQLSINGVILSEFLELIYRILIRTYILTKGMKKWEKCLEI